MKKQLGFTLIELVMVIIILGILAAAAMPKFVNLKTEAALAAAQGVAGGLSEGISINYAVRSFNGVSGVRIANCNNASAVLEGGLPASYVIAPLAVAVGATATCSLTSPNGAAAQNFKVIGIN
ncbi:MAG: type II secretion system protein [Gallionella sp.]